ncbi:hypothetical protein DPMN_103751 [Dreissena polymorpha]|uniref:Uncharacterized protein n=1 Tax=Dreissena polymorpha TaxID=45954 RepID=A0A9D4HET0_DREPO|nr:hypothetical protein DPMN_103751 [Dreissena polymorpha]
MTFTIEMGIEVSIHSTCKVKTLSTGRNKEVESISSAPQVNSAYNDTFQKTVLDQLMSLDNRLNKLDSIEKQLSTLTTKLGNMDTRVTTLECKVKDVDTRVKEVEVSRAFDSQTCEDLKSKNIELDKALQTERANVAELASELKTLNSVSDDIEDLRARSMRCNLLFHGFPEEKSHEARKSENCAKLVLDYLNDKLEIARAHENIKIERAHRLGAKYDFRKPRPVVVMFNHYPDKLLVKQKAQEARKKYYDSINSTSGVRVPQSAIADKSDTSGDLPPATSLARGEPTDDVPPTEPTKPMISVSDQFPKSIQTRRKILLPAMVSAKKDGKAAYLS